MVDFLNSLRRELASLEAELRTMPAYIKAESIRGVLAVYGDDARPAEIGPPMAPRQKLPFVHAGPRGDSKASRARKAIQVHIREKGPSTRADILDALVAQGVIGHEKAPLRQLGTYLSRFPEFVTDGAGLWRLADQKTIEPPGDSPEGGHQAAQ